MSSTSEREVASLITEIQEGRLKVKPFFQRRLVWTGRDKELFLDTVLKGLPFPEIFIATHKVDTQKVRVHKWLVDGQQRVTTLRDYVSGDLDIFYKEVKPFKDLPSEQQQDLLHYKVSVRDLGQITVPEIKEIFRRINSTDYSLNKIEILNALYSGEYKRYCIELSENDFFIRHKVFRKGGDKRMGEITFCVILVTTLQAGYYKRDEKNEEYLRRYNDEFPDKVQTQAELERVFEFIDQCGLPVKSRAWKQTDMFTLLVELHSALMMRKLPLDPAVLGKILAALYDQVDILFENPDTKYDSSSPVTKENLGKYLKAATKASNDKYARVNRAEVVAALIESSLPRDVAPEPKLRASKAKKTKS